MWLGCPVMAILLGIYCLCASEVYRPDWTGINLKHCRERKKGPHDFSIIELSVRPAARRRAHTDPASDGSALWDANCHLFYLTSHCRPLTYEYFKFPINLNMRWPTLWPTFLTARLHVKVEKQLETQTSAKQHISLPAVTLHLESIK